MISEIGEDSLSAHALIQEHRQLFEYWAGLRTAGHIPPRAAFDPARVPRLLPHVFLIDVASPMENSIVRLAGTRVCDNYNREITGHAIASLDWADAADYWVQAYGHAAAGRPAAGVIRLRQRNGTDADHHWLKLPLLGRSGSVEILLCSQMLVAVAPRTLQQMRA